MTIKLVKTHGKRRSMGINYYSTILVNYIRPVPDRVPVLSIGDFTFWHQPEGNHYHPLDFKPIAKLKLVNELSKFAIEAIAIAYGEGTILMYNYGHDSSNFGDDFLEVIDGELVPMDPEKGYEIQHE